MNTITPEKAQQISKAHYALNLCVFFYILTTVAMAATQGAGPIPQTITIVAWLLVVLASVISIIRLASKLYHPAVTIILAFFVFVPVLGGLILLMTSDRASKALKKAGYKVSFLGGIKE